MSEGAGNRHVEDGPALMLVDAARIRELRGLPVNWAEIVETYRDYTSSLLGPFAEAVAASDRSAMVRCLHQLKGCSANLGLVAVVKTCQGMEDDVRGGKLASLRASLSRLRDIIALSVTELGGPQHEAPPRG